MIQEEKYVVPIRVSHRVYRILRVRAFLAWLSMGIFGVLPDAARFVQENQRSSHLLVVVAFWCFTGAVFALVLGLRYYNKHRMKKEVDHAVQN